MDEEHKARGQAVKDIYDYRLLRDALAAIRELRQ
jgi:hypothetical protein